MTLQKMVKDGKPDADIETEKNKFLGEVISCHSKFCNAYFNITSLIY